MDAAEKDAEIAFNKMKARTRLKGARKWLIHIGGLRQGFRGEQILKWGADQAWLAAEKDWKRERSVRNWCRSVAPSLTKAELDQLVADAATSNKSWTNDQCATVLEIGWRDIQEHGFRFIGADDDPNYEIRLGLKREKAAARGRKFRAARSTGAKRGRPALQLSEEERLARNRAQGAERKRAERERKKAAMGVTLKPVTPLKKYNIGSVTHFSVTDRPSPAPKASGRLAPIIIDTQDRDSFDDDGDAFGAPPPTHLVERTPFPF
jgi:hypothetical protein